MIPAKNNILVQIHDSNEYAILNPVSGSFDLMGQKEYNTMLSLSQGTAIEPGFSSYLLERGYAYQSEEEQNAAIANAYAAFQEEVKSSQVQLMFVPTYGCNLACTYCFQHGIDEMPEMASRETIDAFFRYARANFSGDSQKPFVTLFGGEPLVGSPAQKEVIAYFIQQCAAEGYELSAVTNGYDFTEYIALLKQVKIKEIQFTLDGSRAVHDSRRATANRKGTFDRVVAGIDAAIQNNMPVNLRTVVDMENLHDLVNLAEFLDSKGWLELPPQLFKTQLGRNYELFECYAKPQHLLSEVELWGKISSLSKMYPIVSKFHRPDFKGIRHIVDTGELYLASFDTCPACKTEWVFDLYGRIYGCTASCGRDEYLLGTYWPQVELFADAIQSWKTRNVKSIPKCADCKYDVVCGGGCGVVAANAHNGNVHSPDCRPIQELLEIGVNHYINEIRAMSDDEPKAETLSASCCCGPDAETKTKMHSCSCSPRIPTDHTQDCAVCGRELVYSQVPKILSCNICGTRQNAYIYCPDGHFVCDSCHSMDILKKTEKLLEKSQEASPVELVMKIFELPGLKMHGPEYHSIVPAVLIAAAQNLAGTRDITPIKEAISRGKTVKGGNCGLFGNCGAGVGAGIACSVLEGATSMIGKPRSHANRVAGLSLVAISKNVGPRCCKRESITSILSFIKNTEFFNGIPETKYICTQYSHNKDCIRGKCPYFPAAKKIAVKPELQLKQPMSFKRDDSLK